MTSQVGSVGIVYYSNGPGNDLVLSSCKSALNDIGIRNVGIFAVQDPMMLPCTVQSVCPDMDVTIALALITDDRVGGGSLAQTLVSSLFQVGIHKSSPVVPGVFAPGSLLEAKVVLPGLSERWAATVGGFLGMKYNVVYTKLPPPPLAPTVKSPDTLIEDFRATLKARNTTTIFDIGRKFRIIDDDNSNSIELSEFVKVCKEHKLTWTQEQCAVVFNFFDKDRSGHISYDELLYGIRGELNERRKQMVLLAFEIMDTDKSGSLEIIDLKGRFDTSKNPDVIAGRKTNDQVLTEFLHTFEGVGGQHKAGQVSFAEFADYYANISASIDLDDYFELMMRNAWHISGGQGWCENTTCRRVLCIHADGRQTVEEIKNDLGIAADDKATMMKRLKEQGLTDVVNIDLYGSADTASEPVAVTAKGKKPGATLGAPAMANSPRKLATGGRSTITFG